MCMCSIDIKRDQVCDRTASWEGTSIEERATGWRTSSLVRTHIHILEIVTIAIVVQHTVSATGSPQTHWLFRKLTLSHSCSQVPKRPCLSCLCKTVPQQSQNTSERAAAALFNGSNHHRQWRSCPENTRSVSSLCFFIATSLCCYSVS